MIPELLVFRVFPSLGIFQNFNLFFFSSSPPPFPRPPSNLLTSFLFLSRGIPLWIIRKVDSLLLTGKSFLLFCLSCFTLLQFSEAPFLQPRKHFRSFFDSDISLSFEDAFSTLLLDIFVLLFGFLMISPSTSILFFLWKDLRCSFSGYFEDFWLI